MHCLGSQARSEIHDELFLLHEDLQIIIGAGNRSPPDRQYDTYFFKRILKYLDNLISNIEQATLDINQFLLRATKRGDLDVVQSLLHDNAESVFMQDIQLLYYIIGSGDLDVFKLCRKILTGVCFAKVAPEDRRGSTLKLLLKFRVDLGPRLDTLQQAAEDCWIRSSRAGQDELDVNARDSKGMTALHYAHTGDITRALIDSGANMNLRAKDGSSPIQIAVQNQQLSVVEALLEHKADINICDNRDRTPLHLAETAFIAGLLLSNGASIVAKDEDLRTPLHMAAFAGRRSVVELLLRYGADEKTCDYSGQKALHLAATADVARILLENDLVIDIEDYHGKTPLLMAVQEGREDVSSILIQHGADPDQRRGLPLRLAVQSGREEMVNSLIQHGADIDLQDEDGISALHIASLSGSHKMIKILLQKGADINVSTHRGVNPPEMFGSYLFQTHIIKLKIAGLPVSERNLSSPDHDSDESDEGIDELQPFRSSFDKQRELIRALIITCQDEIKSMEQDWLNETVTVLDILRTPNPAYVLNEKLISALECMNYKRYSEYGCLLQSKFKKDKKRIETLLWARESLAIVVESTSTLPGLPYDVLAKITLALGKTDLKNLICCAAKVGGQLRRHGIKRRYSYDYY